MKHPHTHTPSTPEKADNQDDLSAELTSSIEEDFGSLIINDGNKSALNSSALAAQATEEFRTFYSEDNRSFYQYRPDEGLAKPISRRALLKPLSRFIKGVVDRAKVPELLAKATPSVLKGILQLMEGHRTLGTPPPSSLALLPVKTGVLNMSGVAIVQRPYREEDGFTEKLPWAYDPTAKCERFLNELIIPALPNKDDIHLIQRDLGRQLFAGNDAQTISVLVGAGGSGKSVLVSVLEAVLGINKVGHLRSDQLTGRFETHGFHGKSTLVGKDVRPDYLNNQGAAVIKSLTGADRIQTEQKYGGKRDLRGAFYVIITANSRLLLKLHGDKTAWKRRLVVYEFSREAPEKRIPNFDQVLLEEEGEGILAWFIQGYLAHREELREHGTLKLTEAQQQRVDDWLEESDALRAFATESIQAGAGTITVEEVWTSFLTFARERNWRIPRKQRFHEDFPEVMFELFGVERDNHIRRFGVELRGYKGVQFMNQND